MAEKNTAHAPASTGRVKEFSMKSPNSSVQIRTATGTFSDHRARELGFDVHKRMNDMMKEMDAHFDHVRRHFFNLSSLSPIGSADEHIKLDVPALTRFTDDFDKDWLKFNYDVEDFEQETLNVNAVGNSVQVQGQKKTRKGGEERNEDFKRSYELPTNSHLNPASIASQFFHDGVLSVKLPFQEAIKQHGEGEQ